MRLLRTAVAVSVVMLGASAAKAQITRDRALDEVYPGAAIRTEQILLTPTQQKRVLTRADADVPTAQYTRFIATRDGTVIGRAYIDTHTVRTRRETLLISLDDQGRVRRVDVTAFLEATADKALDEWLAQYQNKSLTEDLVINRAIRPLAGAPLTARAVNDAVRRVLAVDEVLRGTAAP